MDLFARLLLYMSRWSRRRPGWQLFIGICVTLAFIAAFAGIEFHRLAGGADGEPAAAHTGTGAVIVNGAAT
jgi:hypothetical protein